MNIAAMAKLIEAGDVRAINLHLDRFKQMMLNPTQGPKLTMIIMSCCPGFGEDDPTGLRCFYQQLLRKE